MGGKTNKSDVELDELRSINVDELRNDPPNQEFKEIPSPPVRPDGGYAWVIVFASFFVSFLVDGFVYTYGVLMIDLVDGFQSTKAKGAMIGSLWTGVCCFLGPFSSGLVNRYGSRPVTMVGSVVCMAAFAFSYLVNDMDVLIVVCGLFGGIGFSLMYLPSVVIIGYYFEAKRALATGITMCGTGVGYFTFALLVQELLKFFGWRGTLLVLGGIIFHAAIMGALFRPLPPGPSVRLPSEQDLTNEKSHSDADARRSETRELINGTKPQTRNQSSSLHDLHRVHKSSKAMFFMSLDNIRSGKTDADNEDLRKLVTRPLFRKDVFYIGSVRNIADHEAHLREVPEVEVPEPDVTQRRQGALNRVCDVFLSVFDLSLLKELTFLVYAFSCFFFTVGFVIVLMYMPDAALQTGMDHQRAALLLSINGATNTAGRIACGWVCDRKWANLLIINNVALTLGGAMTFAVPFCTNFASFSTYSALFGCSMSVFNVLRTVLMVELLGLEKLTSSFGIVQMFQGIAMASSGPLAGAIYDATGYYNATFYVAASSMVLSGLICIPLRKVSAWQRSREATKIQHNNVG